MNTSTRGFLAATCMLIASSPALAVEIQTDSATLFRIERREVTGSYKQSLLPATQFLGLDIDKIGVDNLSFHAYGWGRYDLGDKSYNSDKAAGSLTYGYLQYRFNAANADIRAGRLFIHEGIANEQIDGASVRTDLPYGFGVSAFGGSVVHTRHLPGEKSDGKGDGLFGGRLSYRHKGMLELGTSAVYESTAPKLVNYQNGSYRRYGADLWFSPHKMVELAGHSSYNPETKRAAEHSYLLTLKPIQHLVVAGEFNEHHERSYLYSWAMYSGAGLDPREKSRSTGFSTSYQAAKFLELSADYKHYTRTLGNADRYGADAKLSFFDNRLRSGIGYHYLRAGSGFALTPYTAASYGEARAYALHDTKTYFASLDLIGYFFKQKIYNQKSAWETLASLGYHLTSALALSGDFSYGRNPQFTTEVKGLLRLTYTMTYDSKGAKK